MQVCLYRVRRGDGTEQEQLTARWAHQSAPLAATDHGRHQAGGRGVHATACIPPSRLTRSRGSMGTLRNCTAGHPGQGGTTCLPCNWHAHHRHSLSTGRSPTIVVICVTCSGTTAQSAHESRPGVACDLPVTAYFYRPCLRRMFQCQVVAKVRDGVVVSVHLLRHVPVLPCSGQPGEGRPLRTAVCFARASARGEASGVGVGPGRGPGGVGERVAQDWGGRHLLYTPRQGPATPERRPPSLRHKQASACRLLGVR